MALNTFDITKTQKGPVKIYVGLAVPAADAELTIGTDGVPDATENPNAKMVGLTPNGATVTITKTEEEEYFDEFEEPLDSQVTQVGMSIKCRATQIFDIDVMTAISSGVGTPQTVTGKKKLQIGRSVIVNSGIAAISEQRKNPGMYVVSHIYAGHNIANIDIPFSRQARSETDVEFRGVGIPSREAGDRMGAYWFETA